MFFDLNAVRLNNFFDTSVAWMHQRRILGLRYHPYFFATDLGKLGVIVFGFLYAQLTGRLSFFQFILGFIIVTVAYRGFIQLKGRIFGIWSRSYLQDLLLFVLPCYILTNKALHVPIVTALDLIGFLLPFYLSMIRLGCFLGGCCYGIPARIGVLYPSQIFSSAKGCRNFEPGVNLKKRVFPVQLIESLLNLVVFLTFFYWIFVKSNLLSGKILPIYFLCYSVIRFHLDFLRLSSVRPKWGSLSEAQWISIGIFIGSCFYLIWI